MNSGSQTTNWGGGTPKISVIVPVYNVEKYLRECVDSVLAQTFKDFELILVDDGSPDNSGKICDEYAAKDSRVRVFHKTNGGVSSARNFGIKESRADYIAFLDSDDWWDFRFLEKMNAVAEKFPNAGCCCCGWFNNVSEDGKTIGMPILLPEYELGAIIEIDLIDYAAKNKGFFPVRADTILLKKDAVVRAGGFDETIVIFEDTAMLFTVCLNDGAAFLNETLAFFRRTPFANKPRGRLPDLRKHWVSHLDSFAEAEKTNASTKRFLDNFRQHSVRAYCGRSADKKLVKEILAQVSPQNRVWHFWVFQNLPCWFVAFLFHANVLNRKIKERLAKFLNRR